jgi:cation diffusion facilitator CzcD-associated flavoprotein CzcO/acetyl esterase/lipase
VFSTQAEIQAYLRHCADKYGLQAHIRFSSEVAQAVFDEARSLWHVTLAGGTVLSAGMLVSASGMFGRPAMPNIEGLDGFKGHVFHSAQWDHSCALEGKRVAVVGTGASSIQIVPAIAGKVASLSVFQRSAPHMLPRADRAYTRWERAMFARMPWTTQLYRLGIYLKYESRALAFTRFKWLMEVAVGLPFRRMLAQQVPDAALRARLKPDYPIGCKRILLSNDYLATLARPNVELVTEAIRRVTPDGIETADGVHHPLDAIVFGTGFAATSFLATMRIAGRRGQLLDDAWKRGAAAYLGITVPGFPNFFMLYGPNTGLGHNSAVYMIESQVAHVMRCLRAMHDRGASAVEVDAVCYRRYNQRVQRRLAATVWNGCASWYRDGAGRNTILWPGFSLTYRWLATRSSLSAYSFMRPYPGAADGVVIAPPRGLFEALNAGMVKLLLRTCFRPFVGPPWGARPQRRVVGMLAPLMPGVAGVARVRSVVNGVPAEVVTPKTGKGEGAILYLHGGALCLGSPGTHRSITTRLAAGSGMPVWVPDYRLAPEHPYPAALDDALAWYRALLSQGLRPSQVAVAADSAGALLALALLLGLKARGEPMPAALMLVSPVTDPLVAGETMQSKLDEEPMVRQAWVEQAMRWYACPDSAPGYQPLLADLRGLPPMLVQAGEREILLSDATRLAERAAACGVPCRLEVLAARWHVQHLSAFYLLSARMALRRLGQFARDCVEREAAPGNPGQPAVGSPAAPAPLPPGAARHEDSPA